MGPLAGVRFRALFAWVLLAGLAQCASPYDATTDNAITDLRKKVDDRILALISDDRQIARLAARTDKESLKLVADARQDASYSQNIAFYNAVDSDLTGLQMRIDGTPDLATPKVDDMLKGIRSILLDPPPAGQDPSSMEAVHAVQDHLGAVFLRSTRAQVNAVFATLVQYELTLKSGSK